MPWAVPSSSAAIDIEPAIEQRREPIVWQTGDDASPGTRAIIERCLRFEPADRYESAEQLRRDLDRELNNEPLIAVEEPAAQRVKKWLHRHPRAFSGGSVAALLSLLIVPLVISLLLWRNRSVHLEALAMLDSFAAESSEVLSTVMVDPSRQRDDAITIALAPLEEHGIFADEALAALDSPRMIPADRATYRDAIVRHLAQLAVYETARLKAVMDFEQRDALDAEVLARTDKLLAAAARYQPVGESRALTFLAAERAWLGGDQKASGNLAAQAAKMSLDSDSEQYLEAVRLMSRRHWQAASELLESLADHGTIPSAVRWTLLGRSQFSERKYEQAKLSYTQSIERAPHASRLWLLRGLCYFQLGRYRFAEADFTKAIELEPKLVSAWLDRGTARMAQDRFEEAIADFTAALQDSPGHIHVLLMRSRAYERLEMHDAAARDLDAALKSDKLTWQSLLHRATARKKRNDYEGALADLVRARELNPGSLAILKATAGLYASQLNRLDEAIEILAKIESMEPGNEGAIIDRAVYHARAGQVDQAQAALRKALAPPNSARTLYQAACVNALLNEPPRRGRALGFLSKAIQLGYGGDQFDTDADLDSLRELDGYRAIARTIRMGQAIRSKTAGRETAVEILDADGNVSPIVPQRQSEI
jgi:tetratricopeptide (TPR) repeat protein